MDHFRHPSHMQRLFLLAVLLWTAFIWGNSLQPAAASSAQSQSVVNLFEPLLSGLGIAAAQWQRLIRKAAHMFEFFLLCLLWLGAVRAKTYRLPLGLSLLTACVDEGIQSVVPGRSNQLSDVAIDFSGAVIAAVLCAGALYLLRRQNRTG